MELPDKIVKATRTTPNKVLLYALPKTGKTTTIAQLPDCLIVDFEKGTDLIDAVKVNVENVVELRELVEALTEYKEKNGKNKYRFIALDTATKLEELCDSIAIGLYKRTAMGSKFNGDIVELKALPMGAGYKYVRDAYKKVLNSFVPLCDTLILIGHTKDKYTSKDDMEISAKEIDLTGKLSALVCQNVDAIGYVYRKRNKLMVSFKSDGDIATGNRMPHLSGKEVLLSESDKDTYEVKTFWENIFPDLKKS